MCTKQAKDKNALNYCSKHLDILIFSAGQAPKPLVPTFPIIQLDNISVLDPPCFVIAYFWRPFYYELVAWRCPSGLGG